MIRALRITWQLHLVEQDEDGNFVAEMVTQEPMVMYPHQFSELPKQVQSLVDNANAATE